MEKANKSLIAVNMRALELVFSRFSSFSAVSIVFISFVFRDFRLMWSNSSFIFFHSSKCLLPGPRKTSADKDKIIFIKIRLSNLRFLSNGATRYSSICTAMAKNRRSLSGTDNRRRSTATVCEQLTFQL